MDSFDFILGCPIILVGGSGSGKTTTIMNIIHDIGVKVSSIFLVTCNEQSSASFEGVIPPDIKDKSGQILKFRNVIPVGTERSVIQSKVHDILICAKKLSAASRWVNDNKDKFTSLIKKYVGDYYEDLAQYKKNRKALTTSLQKNPDIPPQELKEIKNFIKYCGINPNTLVIFDDVVPIMKDLEPKIQLFFMEGRHYNITTILSSQKYKSICTGARQSAFFSIFTTQRGFNSFVEENKQSYSKDEKGKICSYAQEIFKEPHVVLIQDEYGRIDQKKVVNIIQKNVERYGVEDIFGRLNKSIRMLLELEKTEKKMDIEQQLKQIK